jgi:hypothetical protein
MINPKELEEVYLQFSAHLQQWAPEGVMNVDLKLLHELGLLNHTEWENSATDSQLTQLFHIIETQDKVTLYNEQFAIWIVPQLIDNISMTTTYIALLQGLKPHLEIVYTTAGVYNAPKYILKVLQHFLTEVQDTEKALSSLGKKQN